jgi:hypothetical protein
VRAANDTNPKIVVGLERIHVSLKLGAHVTTHGVHRFWPIKGEDSDMAVLLEFDDGCFRHVNFCFLLGFGGNLLK